MQYRGVTEIIPSAFQVYFSFSICKGQWKGRVVASLGKNICVTAGFQTWVSRVLAMGKLPVHAA